MKYLQEFENYRGNNLNMVYVASLIERGILNGQNPTWVLNIEMNDKNDIFSEKDKIHVVSMVKQGFLEGELMDKTEHKGIWKLRISNNQ
jgi:hypothetical protein